MNRAEKAAQVEELRKGLTKSGNAILFAFAGLKVPEVTELRRQVRATKSRYRVVKNTLALRAAKGTPLEALSGHFVGATAVAFNEDNPVGLAKVLTAFAKTNPNLVFKAASSRASRRGGRDQDDRGAAEPRGAGRPAALPDAVAPAAAGHGVERAGPEPGGGRQADRGTEGNVGAGEAAPAE